MFLTKLRINGAFAAKIKVLKPVSKPFQKCLSNFSNKVVEQKC
jgi:hypothetical protein